MLYIQDALEEDGNATPFGPNTQALVDTDFGGISPMTTYLRCKSL